MFLNNNKVKNEKKLYSKTGINFLGNIPLNYNNKHLMIENNPKANIMKYIRDIRTNIIKGANNHEAISIISASKGEGKSWVANNIAISLARINKKVLLIDANLREESKKNEIFYTEEGEGLSDFIRNIEIDDKLENLYNVPKYIKETQIPNLYILPSGTITESSYELIKSDKIKELLEILKEIFNYVIIDGCSVFEDEECIELTSKVDKNIIVVEQNRITYDDLIEIKEEIEAHEGQILGLILNKTNIKHGKYYAKDNNSKWGIFIENDKQTNIEEESVEDLINPIIEKLEGNMLSKYETLHEQIKDDILIEDFINDIEVNFNLKLDKIEKEYKKNTKKTLEQILKVEDSIKDTIQNYNIRRNEDLYTYERSSGYIFERLVELKDDIEKLKQEQDIKQQDIIESITRKIQEKNYNEEFSAIFNALKEKNYDAKFNEIINALKEKNYDVEFNNVINVLKEKNYDAEFNNVINVLKEKNYDAEFNNVINALKEKNYDAEFNNVINALKEKNYDEKFSTIMSSIEEKDYDEKFNELIKTIKEKNYNKEFDTLLKAIKENDYNEQIEEINKKLKNLDKKSNDSAKKSNIIDFKKIFFENKKDKEYIFSIDEPISYEDLEKIAVDIVYFDEPENLSERYLF